ncbi:hypothetical protein [Thermosporothrix hazakensis]|uniref:hypothetical protein n=1 Tax=Thermosporothrix hazakensis TaxID=644383 RepID=UPI003530DB22
MIAGPVRVRTLGTVEQAQCLFLALQAAASEETRVLLLHSRFLLHNRQRLEFELEALLGPT